MRVDVRRLQDCHRWCFYAMGGGFGHLTRTVSLVRALIRQSRSFKRDIRIDLITNSRYANLESLRDELRGAKDFVLHRIAYDVPKQDACRQVIARLEDIDPDVLVVDCFPRGLGGELADVLPGTQAFKVLTHRDLNPQYVDAFGIRDFVDGNYDCVLAPGETGPLASQGNAFLTPPWLIRNADELASRKLGRRRLRAGANSYCIAVLQSGQPSEAARFQRIASLLRDTLGSRASVRLIHPPATVAPAFTDCVAIWPLMPWMRGLDLVVGAGGYNSVYECRSVGVPLLAVPMERRYDRQLRRLKRREAVFRDEDIVRFVTNRLEGEASRCEDVERNAPRAYVNGAAIAAAELLQRAERLQRTACSPRLVLTEGSLG